MVSYIGYDQWGGAEKLAQASCELLAKKYNTTVDQTQGKVYILLGIDSIFSHRRTGGFKAGLEKYCPNVEIVGEQTAEWLRTKGSEVATIAWQKDPDIDLFYGNSDEMAIGAALAGEQLGKVINEDFFAVGIDGNQPNFDLLGEGKFSATLGVDPVRMGVTVVDTMQKVLAGEEVPQVLLTPSVVVTPENLQAYLAGELWTEPVAGAPETDNDLPTVPDDGAMTEPGAAMGPVSGAGKNVGFVPPALTSPFHVAMVDGATAEAEAFGWTIDVQAPASEGDFQAFVTTVQQLLEKGVDAMSINPIGTDSAITAVKAANEKGVPILAHNFITPFSEGDVVSYIGYDQWGGAEKLAQATCELLAKKYETTAAETTGKVYILLGIDSIFSHRRTGGFKAGLEKYCPNVEVVGEQTAEWLRTKGSEGRDHCLAEGSRHRCLLRQLRRDGHRRGAGRRAAWQGHQPGLLRGGHRRQPTDPGSAGARQVQRDAGRRSLPHGRDGHRHHGQGAGRRDRAAGPADPLSRGDAGESAGLSGRQALDHTGGRFR